MKIVSVIVAVATCAAAPSASCRVVPYDLDRAAIEAAAKDQNIQGPFSDSPASLPYPIILEPTTAADHTVKTVSIYCQAYKIENPVSVLMQHLLPPSQVPTDTSDGFSLRLVKGSTLLRCLGTGELKTTCKNEVKLSAEIRFTRSSGEKVIQPVAANVDRDGHVGGFCGNIARYTEIVSREAGIAIIAKARAVYEQDRAAP